MEGGLRKQENLNCQCQCHYPSNIICQITSCCHCMCNYEDSINYSPGINNRFYSSYSNSNCFKNENNPGLNLMSSYSTNFRSGNQLILRILNLIILEIEEIIIL